MVRFRRVAVMSQKDYMTKNNMRWLRNPKTGRPFMGHSGYDSMVQVLDNGYRLFVKDSYERTFDLTATVVVNGGVMLLQDLNLAGLTHQRRLLSMFSSVIKPAFTVTYDDLIRMENKYIVMADGSETSRPEDWSEAVTWADSEDDFEETYL